MSFTDVIILIPSHSLEDFPTEQTETAAAGLLNSFAVAWHPRFLAGMPQLPRWHRADDPPTPHPDQLYFVPDVCDGWLPHGWQESAREAGATVVDQVFDRQEMLSVACKSLPPLELDADLVADFFALGTCWLQVELLTRHMRNFGNIDEIRLQNRAIAAAKAVVAHDRETAEAHLRASFEVLLEARERFYPVDSYLMDLALIIPDVADDHLLQLLQGNVPVNLLLNARDLLQISETRPDIVAELTTAVQRESAGIIGGEYQETASPLLPIHSWLFQLNKGRNSYLQLLGKHPKVWGRRRFGLHNCIPQMATKLGCVGALHLSLDDGIYPDAEHSRFRWQGCDESIVEAFSRIPLAADSAATFLRFPVRMAESMDHDHVAGVCLARWPEVKSPFLDDLRRSQKYAPVVGKFVTFEQFFAITGSPGRLTQHPAGGYFTPFLLQHAARREADPVSRYADHTIRRLRFDAINLCRALECALTGKPIESEEESAAEALIEQGGPDRQPEFNRQILEEELKGWESRWTRGLANVLMTNATVKGTGLLIVNPFRFNRRFTFPWPEGAEPPIVSDSVKAVDTHGEGQETTVTVDLPGCGFTWLSTRESRRGSAIPKRNAGSRKLPAVEPGVLRNERLELSFHEITGGIAQVRNPQKRENRFSQLVSYRFSKERLLPAEGDQPAVKSQYAETRCLSMTVLKESGSTLEMESRGEVIDQLTQQCLAKFTQRTRLHRHRPVIDFDIELSDVAVPVSDPWNNYFCTRFAWDSSSATLTRSWLDGAQEIGNDRIESTQYLEVADEEQRLTIIPHGLPFHRKSGARMLDTLLVVTGETRRTFSFSVAIDHSFPLEAAWDSLVPPYIIPTETGFVQTRTSGWLLHVDSRNVQILKLGDLTTFPTVDSGPRPPEGTTGFVVRLLETEGRAKQIRLRTFHSPIHARKCNLEGATLGSVSLEDDVVVCDLSAYELADIELRFG